MLFQTAMYVLLWMLTLSPCESTGPKAFSQSLTLDLPGKWQQMGQYKAYGRKVPLPPQKSSLVATEHTAERHKNITIL